MIKLILVYQFTSLPWLLLNLVDIVNKFIHDQFNFSLPSLGVYLVAATWLASCKIKFTSVYLFTSLPKVVDLSQLTRIILDFSLVCYWCFVLEEPSLLCLPCLLCLSCVSSSEIKMIIIYRNNEYWK